MEPGGFAIIPILSQIKLIPRIDTYLYNVHSNIHLQRGLPKDLIPVSLHVRILKGLLSSSILTR